MSRVISAFVGFLLVFTFLGDSATAASAEKIDRRVVKALERFYEETDTGETLAAKAKGMLVFPKVTKAGLGIGGEYGEGALLIDGKTVQYYSTASASIGFQIGAQQRIQILLFMTDEALSSFRDSDGWEAGVDGSIALVEVGAGADLDTNSITAPIIGYVLGQKGLMANISLEGTKISKIDRD